jgi:hypothetical protein
MTFDSSTILTLGTIVMSGVSSYVHLLIKTAKQDEQIRTLFSLQNKTNDFEKEIRHELSEIKQILINKNR